jgi:putative transposase
MGKPYSMDLRARVVAAVESGLSRNAPARRFNVAISTAINWVRRKEEILCNNEQRAVEWVV